MQRSRLNVIVVLSDLVDPHAERLAGRTFPLVTECQVDVVLECRGGWRLFVQPGSVGGNFSGRGRCSVWTVDGRLQ